MFALLVRSWFIAHLAAAVLALPLAMALQPVEGGVAARLAAFIGAIPLGFLLSFTLGFLVSVPLLALAALGALLLRPWIIRYPYAIAGLAILATHVLVTAYMAETLDNPWAHGRGFGEKFRRIALSRDTMIIVLPAAIAALDFTRRFSLRERNASIRAP